MAIVPGGSVDPDDSDVVKMKRRCGQYCLQRATVPEAEYFCVTALVDRYGSFSEAAKACGIGRTILASFP